MTLNVKTLATSVRLYLGNRSRYYLALAAITASHTIDLGLTNFGYQDPNYGVSETSTLIESGLLLQYAALAFFWVSWIGFTLLNYLRLRDTSPADLSSAWAQRALLLTVVLFILFATVSVLLQVVQWVVPGSLMNLSLAPVGEVLTVACSFWDIALNVIMSVLFLRHIRSLGVATSVAHVPLRRGLASLLTTAHVYLGVECAVMVFINLMVLINPELDPCWSTVYLAQAIRLHMYCSFLEVLAEIMSRKAKGSARITASHSFLPSRHADDAKSTFSNLPTGDQQSGLLSLPHDKNRARSATDPPRFVGVPPLDFAVET
ncbi:hypothetical protein AMAG_17985 [Allomyces macrogynus ATCC 38327]|uniref:THH1/TOM1/TOM3 domain-containing protein n=1 Tax=Allomyces macrogynus (strain ATCC 38327) TaxID=578462 RepID=A0A0L0S369_ALLM3|nr:hypothetical protein AMAG_17985 [Allomyces macrogynus ATCC 38327]|eukprot:KNE56973.1 hypothetical protein AMAG_17985 [Allomyces macrogynus ATCC 38327]